MSVLYRHSQRGTAILTGLALTAPVVMIALLLLLWPRDVWPATVVVIAVLAALIGTGWYFSSMTVEVTEDELRWYFGPGRYFRIARSDIESVGPVRHSLFCGYGIRWMGPKCWAYIIAGREAVDVRLKSGGRCRLGTDDRDRLIAVLTSAEI
jgi:hypothetical protein